MVVRVYEANGGRSQVRFEASLDAAAEETDLLERSLDAPRVVLEHDGDRSWTFELRPFQLATVRLRRSWHSPGESANI